MASIQALRRRARAFKRTGNEGNEFGIKHHSEIDQYAKLDQCLKVEQGATQEVSTKSWRLNGDGWYLMTPLGNSVELTEAERQIMFALISNAPNLVKREDLGSGLSSSQGAKLARTVDVQISRLKQKMIQFGETPPIRAVRGKGYVFLGDVAEP